MVVIGLLMTPSFLIETSLLGRVHTSAVRLFNKSYQLMVRGRSHARGKCQLMCAVDQVILSVILLLMRFGLVPESLGGMCTALLLERGMKGHG